MSAVEGKTYTARLSAAYARADNAYAEARRLVYSLYPHGTPPLAELDGHQCRALERQREAARDLDELRHASHGVVEELPHQRDSS